MSLTHAMVTLNSTATLLTIPFASEPDYASQLTIIVQNLDQSKHVLLGGSNVTTTSYGHKLEPGSSIEFKLSPWDELYAVADTGTLSAGVIRIQKNAL